VAGAARGVNARRGRASRPGQGSGAERQLGPEQLAEPAGYRLAVLDEARVVAAPQRGARPAPGPGPDADGQADLTVQRRPVRHVGPRLAGGVGQPREGRVVGCQMMGARHRAQRREHRAEGVADAGVAPVEEDRPAVEHVGVGRSSCWSVAGTPASASSVQAAA